MRIAHVCSEYSPAISGVGQVVEELAKRQVKAGHEVHVYAPDWDKSKRISKREEVLNGVNVHRCFHIARISDFATVWPSVFPKLIKGKFDIVHTHVFGHVHFVLSALATGMTGARHFHTTHCPWTDAHRSSLGRLGVSLSYNVISRFAFRLTDKIIAITPWEFDFIKKYGGSEEQIVNLPNGMAGEFFERVKDNGFKKKHGLEGKKMVLFFGRLSVTKGPEKFVDIAKKILEKRDDVRFVIRGPDEGMLEIVKKKIGNEKRILLLDATRDRKEIIEMYQAADVFVLPSFREGLPLTLFEAMASGLPVVATPVNGIPFEIKEPENGFLVEYGDIEGFVGRVVELLDDKKLREEIGGRNLKRSEKYKWEDIEKKTMQLYLGEGKG
jgi:glycosyltransferase involved in cell wall biosynthesis